MAVSSIWMLSPVSSGSHSSQKGSPTKTNSSAGKNSAHAAGFGFSKKDIKGTSDEGAEAMHIRIFPHSQKEFPSVKLALIFKNHIMVKLNLVLYPKELILKIVVLVRLNNLLMSCLADYEVV